jgi:hypothetical protein
MAELAVPSAVPIMTIQSMVTEVMAAPPSVEAQQMVELLLATKFGTAAVQLMAMVAVRAPPSVEAEQMVELVVASMIITLVILDLELENLSYSSASILSQLLAI